MCKWEDNQKRKKSGQQEITEKGTYKMKQKRKKGEKEERKKQKIYR